MGFPFLAAAGAAGGILSGIGSIFGASSASKQAKKDRQAQINANAWNQGFAMQQLDETRSWNQFQKEAYWDNLWQAQNPIEHRVNDARRAGVHPLFALGQQTSGIGIPGGMSPAGTTNGALLSGSAASATQGYFEGAAQIAEGLGQLSQIKTNRAKSLALRESMVLAGMQREMAQSIAALEASAGEVDGQVRNSYGARAGLKVTSGPRTPPLQNTGTDSAYIAPDGALVSDRIYRNPVAAGRDLEDAYGDTAFIAQLPLAVRSMYATVKRDISRNLQSALRSSLKKPRPAQRTRASQRRRKQFRAPAATTTVR